LLSGELFWWERLPLLVVVDRVEVGERVAEDGGDLPSEGRFAAAAAADDGDPVHVFRPRWMGPA
jgi:hypothetical protein